MPELNANGLTIHYDEHGDPSHPAMLLVMGIGAQMTHWPDELVEALAAEGFRVIRYDNRDVGLSQKMDGQKAPSPVKQVLMRKIGMKAKVPYTLSDMARDGMGVLDALGIEKAHVVGGSMGGMIAQLMAIEHGERLLSLTSIFSTTGNSKLPQADKRAMDALTKRPDSLEEEALVEHGIMVANAIGSPAFKPEAEALRERVLRGIRRSVYPEGFTRQMAAIIDDGDRTQRLANVRVPTLVLHGEADPLVKVEGGRATAAAIPGARLETIEGWGHDLPLPLVGDLTKLISDHAKAAAD